MTAGTAITTTTKRDFDDVNRERIEAKENKRLMEVRDLQQALKQARDEVDQQRSRADSIAARQTVLERDNQHLRLCLTRIMEKTQNDDRLIVTYKEELEAQRSQLTQHIRELNEKLRIGRAEAVDAQKEAQRDLEVARLNETVADLRRQLARRAAAFEDSSPIDSIFAVKADDDSVLAAAQQLIQMQRDAIVAYEQDLAKAERAVAKGVASMLGSGASPTDAANFVRQENASLKQRLADLSSMMKKEIEMFKRSADLSKSELDRIRKGRSSAVVTGSARGQSGALPPVGRRPSSSSARTPPPGTTAMVADEEYIGDSEVEARDLEKGEMAAAFAKLQAEHADLKKAYNGAMYQAMKAEERARKAST